MWSPPAPGARCAGAGDPRSSLECVSRDRGGGGASLAMPGMRGAGRKDRATTVQGAIQQAVRRDRGEACESAAASQVARRFHLPETTVRAIDLRYLERWDQRRRKPALKQIGVDEIYRGKKDKFLTVVSNLETGEPLWFGKERKKETLDEYFRTQLRSGQCKRIEAACVDKWEPFRLSIEEWAPACRIVYDKFHIIQHANDAVDEVRRAEFFRKGRKMRDVIKGKKWLLLSRWKNLARNQRGVLNRVFQLNRRVFKAYLLKESLEKLWDYRYEGAMLNYLQKWIDQLRWQRLPSFQKLAEMLLKHLEGILNYCRTKVQNPFEVFE